MALWDSLLAGYKFEEASGDRADVLGVNALTENGTVAQAAGIIGNAAATFSTTNYLSLATPLITSDPFSVSLWFYFTTNTTEQVFFFQPSAQLIKYDGVARSKVIHFNPGSAALLYTVTPTTSAWHHLVCTSDGTNAKIYYDGVYRATGARTYSGTPTDTHVGLGSGTAPLTGRIDSLYLWSKALTDGGVSINNTAGGEVAELYNGGAGRDFGNPWNYYSQAG